MQKTAQGAALLAVLPILASAACSGSSRNSGISMHALGTPGACASIVEAHEGRVTVEQAVGTGPADTESALFDIGSAAKSLTAAAIVVLAQEGKLSPSTTIARLLPNVPRDKRDITIDELLTHTSGLAENFTADRTRIGRDGALKAILALKRESGRGFRYSNAGYTLLAAIVERVADMPFRQFVEDRLLRPSGMTSTGWYGESPPPATRPVHGHVDGHDTGPAGTQAPNSWATLGAGGMTSTAADLVRWMTAVNQGPLFSSHWRNIMFEGRVGIGAPGARAAYGWVVGTTATGQPLRLVGGDTDYGFTSDLRYYPTQRVATVALSCSDTTPAIDLGHDLETAVMRT